MIVGLFGKLNAYQMGCSMYQKALRALNLGIEGGYPMDRY
jgi:hypothetical protein